MKRLTLLRHANSTWNQPGFTDFERPLNDRGRRDAAEMGTRLANRSFKPEHILTSAAQRAIETVDIIAPVIDYPLADVVHSKTLYNVNLTDMFNFLEKLDEALEHILIVGHNPTWTELANSLITGPALSNIPSGGIVDLELEIQTWNEIHENCATLLNFDSPE